MVEDVHSVILVRRGHDHQGSLPYCMTSWQAVVMFTLSYGLLRPTWAEDDLPNLYWRVEVESKDWPAIYILMVWFSTHWKGLMSASSDLDEEEDLPMLCKCEETWWEYQYLVETTRIVSRENVYRFFTCFTNIEGEILYLHRCHSPRSRHGRILVAVVHMPIAFAASERC